MFSINFLSQKLYCIFVRNIFYHQCCTLIVTNVTRINQEITWIIKTTFLSTVTVIHKLILIHRCYVRRVMIVCTCYTAVFIIWSCWITAAPNLSLTVTPFLLLSKLWFHLLNLTPIKADAICLDFLKNLVGNLSWNIWRLPFSP